MGLGLRFSHFDDILENKPTVPWFEVITDDFLISGPHFEKLEKLRSHYPIVFHSVGLNLGGVDPLEEKTLKNFKRLYQQFEPQYISDHLCWSQHAGKFHHDLLPIPKTKEGLENICSRINYLQEYFSRPLVVENITSYVDFKNEEFSEIDFIKEVCKRTDCSLLLDISNVLINHQNRKLDFQPYLDNFFIDRVTYCHLAGGVSSGGLTIDSHSENVAKKDVAVLKQVFRKQRYIPCIIERDSNIPSFKNLNEERAEIAERLYDETAEV